MDGNPVVMKKERGKGFTLVELVSVIALLGIIASVASSRFFDRDDFDRRIHSDQLLSLFRSVQQLAFSRDNVDLYIQDLGSEISFSSRVDGVESESRKFSKNEISIKLDTSGIGGEAGQCSGLSSTLTIAFSEDAELDEGYLGGTYENGFSVCLNGDNPSLCISPAGFAHLGSCV